MLKSLTPDAAVVAFCVLCLPMVMPGCTSEAHAFDSYASALHSATAKEATFPELSRIRGEEGTAVFVVSSSDVVLDVSSSSAVLDRSAERAVKAAVKTLGPAPDKCRVLIPVEFRLTGGVK